MRVSPRKSIQPTAAKAAQYVRMSSEHQKYSIHNQLSAISSYAAVHGIEIVRTYQDVAKSGLSLKGRSALSALIHDVVSGVADFNMILVYDVSRWGRFLDADESAHYEFLCRSAGVEVRYCTEPFNEAGIAGGLFKVLKRAMAAEFSRELSPKVFAGQSKAVRQGFHAGAMPAYGIRRMLVGENGAFKHELGWRQYKNTQAERVALIPGPQSEQDTVRRIFDLFAVQRKTTVQIATLLNDEAVPAPPRGKWSFRRIGRMLENEVYIGNLVYNKKTQYLRSPVRPNPREKWIRYVGALPAIVNPQIFDEVQRILGARSRRQSDAELLSALAALHERTGHLTCRIIDREPNFPGTAAYRHRFGSVEKAYELIGYHQVWERGR